MDPDTIAIIGLGGLMIHLNRNTSRWFDDARANEAAASTSPPPGWTAATTRRAARSTSTGTSTPTRRPARWRRSTRT